MTELPQWLAERLHAECEKTVEFFTALPEAAWQVQIYSEGTCWKIAQVLGHFVTTERALSRLIENIRQGGPGAPPDFDINRYNESQLLKLGERPVVDLLDQFKQLRQENIDRVAGMQPAELTLNGRHPFLGEASLEEIIKMIYRHNQIHQREIRKVLAG